MIVARVQGCDLVRPSVSAVFDEQLVALCEAGTEVLTL
jgi:hypothetical protein